MEHITPLPFHERLKYEREQRGWSQEYLAGKVGSDPKDGGTVGEGRETTSSSKSQKAG